MIDPLIQWVAQHGYGVIFVVFALGVVALPVPNELLLAYLGYLVYKGELSAVPTVGSAFLGSVCGMMLNYLLGRTIGCYLIKKFGGVVHVTAEKIDRVHDLVRAEGQVESARRLFSARGPAFDGLCRRNLKNVVCRVLFFHGKRRVDLVSPVHLPRFLFRRPLVEGDRADPSLPRSGPGSDKY